MKRAISFCFIALAAIPLCVASNPKSKQTLPFRLLRDSLIVVSCSIANQRNLTCIVDTGTTETILDTGLTRRLSLRTWLDSAVSLTRNTPARGVSIPDVHVGPLWIDTLDGVAMDLAPFGKELAVHPDVVIGIDVLHRSNFVVDYQARTITFGAEFSAGSGGGLKLAHSTPIVPAARFVLVDSNVLGKSVRLQVDSGFNGLLLYNAQREVQDHALKTGASVVGVSTSANVFSLDSPEVRIGNWRTTHLSVSVIQNPRPVAEFQGVLGSRLLSERRVAFDFHSGTLYWD